ncbi:hypothetical protein AC578_4682 [Pseudocercospora eumusae]|uniref:SMODS and SLOG-associating 2TM effector domain-containing protein n=1 Tax=Pseudocercospora eumusae TaxID=321146 RepID=A0A139H7E6_9PEZI|nr:hypothetical protein AC578_4682 [Pseudocercospora eumusae]
MAADKINPEKVPVASVTIASSSRGHMPLQLFQILVGIHTPPSLTQDGCNVRSHKGNVGLYQRTRDEERQGSIAYLLTNYISDFLFMLQILLAATFAELSAYKDFNAATLTILGALNTVVAGFISLSSPDSLTVSVGVLLRGSMDQYQTLLLEIEMTKRAFIDLETNNTAGGLADRQANYPDLYVSTGASAVASHETKDLAKQLEDVKAAAAKTRVDMRKRMENLMESLEAKGEAKVEKAAEEEVLKI